ncbi:CPBP family glutamic-type intramembrane protease [Georgenia soli]|uniref:CPBP family glutamic-type intramembrane protease n=1 Tax=Georgenia soli TaxID=638953 RepID=UPI000BFAA8D3|nr:CPBP family glutamic-type intramembrane protease [Georgenia soli]
MHRHSALTVSLVVGALWALWHLPLIMGGDPTMSACPVLPFVVWMIAEAVLCTWLYNSARGSLLVAVLRHGISNVLDVLSSAPWMTATVTVTAAVLVIAVFGPERLCRTGRRAMRPTTTASSAPTVGT